uniref:EamA domain-containing protein n=1 Tax=Helicotheca tamesis TaxID=374047 RepID=A0A7S2E3P2_9STRA|mmetsp:Transcript_11729/g.16253  ORF Transcript_11729/g.16253 Transcript_11729/m.16253 type:complete len:564 (+) Transcript_11729:222-1913(+)
MYSLQTSIIILSMILTGAGRSVAVKLFYQLGFCNPLFVTLLYLAGQGLSLLVYFAQKLYSRHRRRKAVAVFPVGDVEEDGGGSQDVKKKKKKGGKHYCMVELSEVSTNDDDDGQAADNENISDSSSDEKKDYDSIEEGRQQRKGVKTGWLGGKRQQYTLAKQKDSNIENDDDDIVFAGNELTSNDTMEDAFSNEATPDGQMHVSEEDSPAKDDCEDIVDNPHKLVPAGGQQQRTKRKRRGSKTGLTSESTQAVAWVHKIPTHLKPAIPGFFNLCNSAMRWASLVFVAASTAEMLISGLELILSTVAARIIRKRLVSKMRWMGVCVVALGLILVRIADSGGGGENDDGETNSADMEPHTNDTSIDNDNVEGAFSENDGNSSTNHDRLIGDILIVGQCIMSIIQDMAEELFMQESDFPPTLLLGMEGIFGLIFGIPLYLSLASRFGESPMETWHDITASSFNIVYMVALTCLFTVTGIFNIAATSVTSSMTRNVWKNFRTVLVWGMGLVIYYATGNEDLGEEWRIPNSFYVLIGFLVMLSGAFSYYRNDDDLPHWTKICLPRWVM